MSDVGSTLIPPGLPLRDPPRMAGSCEVSMNDPVFGMSSGSIPCENRGHRPAPAQAPIPPPQGVGDPVAQLLMVQGAMTRNESKSSRGSGDPSQPRGRQGNTSGASENRKEMKIHGILEELDFKRKRIIGIQELVGAVFRLAMPDS